MQATQGTSLRVNQLPSKEKESVTRPAIPSPIQDGAPIFSSLSERQVEPLTLTASTADPFRHLETDSREWEEAQLKRTEEYLKQCPSMTPIGMKLFPMIFTSNCRPVERGYRLEKTANQDMFVLFDRNGNVMNPNQWPGEFEADFSEATRDDGPREWRFLKDAISPDGRFIAFSVDKSGSEDVKICVLDRTTNTWLTDTTQGRYPWYVCWSPDNSGFYYSASPVDERTKEKGTERHFESVYYHTLGTKADQDTCVFSSKDPLVQNCVEYSEDGNYRIFTSEKGASQNEVHIQSITGPALIPIATGFKNAYQVRIIGDAVIILTDKDAPMSQVFITDVHNAPWKVFIPEDPEFNIRSVKPLGGLLYVEGIKNVRSEIRVYDLVGNLKETLALPFQGTASVYGSWNDPLVRLHVQSFFNPKKIFERNGPDAPWQLLFEVPIPSFDPSRYTLKQVEYTSFDGVKATMDLMYRNDFKPTGDAPTILAAYGGFNIPSTPIFFPPIIAWVDAGGVCALPHIRGGGEHGKQWHDAGVGVNKKSSIEDFCAAAKCLVDTGITTASKIGAFGGSNGGLVVASAMALHPELFGAVCSIVPLTDMLRYHTCQLGVSPEYGSPDIPEEREALLSYSPLHNLHEGVKYPSFFGIAAEHDARCAPWHVMKFVEQLQQFNPDGNAFYFSLSGGHQATSDKASEQELQLNAMLFFMKELLLTVPKLKPVQKIRFGAQAARLVFNRVVASRFRRKKQPQLPDLEARFKKVTI